VAKHLAELDNEVYVVSRRMSQKQPKYEKIDGFHVYRIYRGIVAPLPFSKYEQPEAGKKQALKARFYEKYLFTLLPFYASLFAAHLIKKHDLEIIVERETSFGAGGLASVICRKPLVLEIIGPRYSKLSFNKAEEILAYTETMIHESPIPQKVTFVDAAADTELFRPDADQRAIVRSQYGFSSDVVIGYVGMFAGWHGVEELIEASVDVVRHTPNVKFLMVGPYFEKVKEQVERTPFKDSFIFTGPVPHEKVPAFINAMDITVAPYNPSKSPLRSEYGIGSPLKVFEYMACGKPVIATSVEPILRIINHMENGILVPPGDSKALAKAISFAVQNREKMEEIGEKGRQTVLAKYSWKAFAKRLNKILKEVLAKHSSERD
jgi:glycosyltransferase involved in cell wall biosynthesis